MKIAPLLSEIRKQNNIRDNGGIHIDYLLVHTGQHYDVRMSDAFFRDLNILTRMLIWKSVPVSHAVQTAEILVRFEKNMSKERPDWLSLLVT